MGLFRQTPFLNRLLNNRTRSLLTGAWMSGTLHAEKGCAWHCQRLVKRPAWPKCVPDDRRVEIGKLESLEENR